MVLIHIEHKSLKGISAFPRPHPDQVGVGEGLNGGGHRTGGQAGEGLPDRDSGSDESSDDDRQPDESDETSGDVDVDKTSV